jgi:predicted amidohydrolase YtcJ
VATGPGEVQFAQPFFPSGCKRDEMNATLIVTNANVLTLDEKTPNANAIAMFGDRILGVGESAEIQALSGPDTKVIDANGATVLPGLNDNHCHPMNYGFSLGWINASPSATPTLRELQDAFSNARQNAQSGEWLRGRGYDDSRLDVHRHPTKEELDKVTGDNPAILTRTCGHMSVVNSAALRLAGVDGGTSDPPGGRIVRDEHGEPTGLLQEEAQRLVTAHIPETTVSDIKDALIRAGNRFLEMGITSVGEAAIRTSKEMRAYQELHREGRLPVRTYLMMLIDDTLDSLEQLGITTGMGDEWLRIGPAKMFQDGSGGGRTAAMSVAYPDQPDNFGIQIYPQEYLDDAFTRAARAGFQGTAHAIGDQAIDMIITAFERALAKHPQHDHRWRIEHCGMMRRDLLKRMQALQLIPVPQPSFVYYLGDSYLENFGEDWITLSYPNRTWIDMGMRPVGSSDAPVTPAEPWFNIRAAVTRLTLDDQEMAPDQRVSINEALQMFTHNGAFATFEESIKGKLQPGMLADLIVVDKDPHSVNPEELHTIENQVTISGGRVAFEA